MMAVLRKRTLTGVSSWSWRGGGLQESVGELRAGSEHASVLLGITKALLRSGLAWTRFHASPQHHPESGWWNPSTLLVRLACRIDSSPTCELPLWELRAFRDHAANHQRV